MGILSSPCGDAVDSRWLLPSAVQAMIGAPATFHCRCVDCSRCWLMGAVRAGAGHELFHMGETILPWVCPFCGASKDPQIRPGSVASTLLDAYTTFADEESDGPAKHPRRSGLPPKKRVDP